MPRYFLDVSVGMAGGRDLAGVRLRDAARVRRAAFSRAAMVASKLHHPEKASPVVVTARDDSGAAFVRVSLVCRAE